MSSCQKDISYKGGKIKIVAQLNKYMVSNYLYLKFETSEKSLLYNLLEKYIHEKILMIGINRINETFNAFATEKGIMLNCSERKIFINIANVLSYLIKTKLSNKELDRVAASEANYNKLHKDISTFTAYISGKCPHVQKSLTNSGDKKLERLTDMLSKAEPKNIETAKIKNPYEYTKIDFSGSSREKLDLAICLEDVPFTIEGDKIKLLDPHSACAIVERSEFEFLQSKLKTFLICCGSPGTPSANDKDGSAYKKKCANILESLNAISHIMADIHGFNHSFKDVKDIQDGVNLDSKTKIKEVFKEVKKTFS